MPLEVMEIRSVGGDSTATCLRPVGTQPGSAGVTNALAQRTSGFAGDGAKEEVENATLVEAPDPHTEEARFCEWALGKLGHVTVFAFARGESCPFMIVADNGERTRGKTLAIALQEMLNCLGMGMRKPLVSSLHGRRERAA